MRSIIILLVIWAIWGVVATVLLMRQPTGTQFPTATLENSVTSESTVFYENGGPFITFPLACPRDMAVHEGATWRDITIGVSSITDIEDLYGTRFTNEPQRPWLNGDFAAAYSILLTPEGARERKLPQSADLCLVGGKILALSLSLAYDDSLPSSWLQDWISVYGTPELVTWAATGNEWRWRTIVWPQHGIAVEVDVSAVENDQRAALVNSVTFFPYAHGDNYLSQWPYTGLNRQTPTSNNDAGDPTEENPFDFDVMLATPTPSN